MSDWWWPFDWPSTSDSDWWGGLVSDQMLINGFIIIVVLIMIFAGFIVMATRPLLGMVMAGIGIIIGLYQLGAFG